HSRASVDPVTLALTIESVTPGTSVGIQPETSYGAGLPAAKRGAIVTPDGRLESARGSHPDRGQPNRGEGPGRPVCMGGRSVNSPRLSAPTARHVRDGMRLGGAPRIGVARYRPRVMEGTVLHWVVREHFKTLYRLEPYVVVADVSSRLTAARVWSPA